MKIVVTGRVDRVDMVEPKPFDTPLSKQTAEIVIVTLGGDFHEPSDMAHRAQGEYRLRTNHVTVIEAIQNARTEQTPITITISIPEF